MKRTAKCLCGQLHITVQEDPAISMACNCTNCQRRTGSAFGAITYFKNSQVVDISGEVKQYSFEVDSGNTNTTSFCPHCGSTVFFKADLFPGMTGIAAGCFNDPNLPEPTFNAWTQSKYKWMNLPQHWHAMEKQMPS